MKKLLLCLTLALSSLYAVADRFKILDSLLEADTPYHSTLKQIDSYQIYAENGASYSGEIIIQGVLEIYHGSHNKRSVWFIPDRQTSNPLPQLSTAMNPIYYDKITLIDDITDDDDAFKKARQIFAHSLNPNDRYTLGGVFMRVRLTLQDYKYIQRQNDEKQFSAKVKLNSVQVLSRVVRERAWYLGDLHYGFGVPYVANDSYINLLKSPNGRVIRKIYKDSTGNCDFPRSHDKGYIIRVANEPNDSKWIRVAYFPADAEDSSDAIYGVVQSNQVGDFCFKKRRNKE